MPASECICKLEGAVPSALRSRSSASRSLMTLRQLKRVSAFAPDEATACSRAGSNCSSSTLDSCSLPLRFDNAYAGQLGQTYQLEQAIIPAGIQLMQSSSKSRNAHQLGTGRLKMSNVHCSPRPVQMVDSMLLHDGL